MNIDGLISLLGADLTLKEIRVVMAFAFQEGKYGKCSMSLTDLVNMIGATPPDICATMSKLERKGILHRLDAGKRGRGATSYHVRISYPSDEADFVPVDTDPDTLSDRRAQELEKRNQELEKQLKETSNQLESERKKFGEAQSTIATMKKNHESHLAQAEESKKKAEENEDAVKTAQESKVERENNELKQQVNDLLRSAAEQRQEESKPSVMLLKLWRSILGKFRSKKEVTVWEH